MKTKLYGRAHEDDFLCIKNRREVTRVPVEDIMYVLRDGRKLIVVTPDIEYVYYEKIENVAKKLKGHFCRVLSRCIINFNYVKSVNVAGRRCIFINGDELYLGRDSLSRLKKEFLRYLLAGEAMLQGNRVAEEGLKGNNIDSGMGINKGLPLA